MGLWGPWAAGAFQLTGCVDDCTASSHCAGNTPEDSGIGSWPLEAMGQVGYLGALLQARDDCVVCCMLFVNAGAKMCEPDDICHTGNSTTLCCLTMWAKLLVCLQACC